MPEITLKSLLSSSRLVYGEQLFPSELRYRVSTPLTNAELAAFSEYIEAPTRTGYWRLLARWRYDGAFSQFIFDKIAAEFFGESQPDSKSNIDSSRERADRSEFERHELINSFAARVSSPMELLLAAVYDSRGESLPPDIKREMERDRWRSRINLSEFRQQFLRAFELFRDRLFAPDFNGVFTDELVRTGSGLVVVLEGPRRSGNLIIASMESSGLIAFGEILKELGQVEDLQIQRVFSPEEELFQPYFTFLSATFHKLISDDRVKPQFKQAFDYFKKEDFVHCVSTLGLVAEDYFTQIYETYLREPCPKGLTLGQISDRFHDHVQELVRLPREQLVSLDSVYDEIKQLAKLTNPEQPNELLSRLITALRDILGVIRSDRKHFSQKIDDAVGHNQRVTVFPAQIRENLTELIRYRNAASHKTRVPLGQYEALRTLYCLTSFVMWWRRNRDAVDWGGDKQQILTAAVSQVSN